MLTNEIITQLNELSKFERMTYVASLLDNELEKSNTKSIIVGGLSLEIYTFSEYATTDIDLIITNLEKAKEVLTSFGFENNYGIWIHRDIDVIVEVVDQYLGESVEESKLNQININGRSITVIGIEDILIDRLNAGVHWKSPRDIEWATRLYDIHKDRLDQEYLTKASKREGILDALDRIRNSLKLTIDDDLDIKD